MASLSAVRNILTQFQSKRRRRNDARPSATEALEPRTLLTLLGTNATVQRTLDAGAGDVSQGSSASAIVTEVDNPEIAAFQNQYDINFDGTSITLTGTAAAGTVAAGTTERLHFSFDGLLVDQSILSASADDTQTLVPNVTITGGNSLVVELPEGTQIGSGFDAVINVNAGERERGLIGAEINTQNFYMFEDASQPQDMIAFELPEHRIVENRATPEVSQFLGLYDIDFQSDAISMVYNRVANPPAKPNAVGGLTDIYRFEVTGLAPGVTISSATADTAEALQPAISIVDGNIIEARITSGQSTGIGFNARINLTFSEASEPVTGTDFTVRHTTESNLGTGGTEVPSGTEATSTVVNAASEAELTSFNDIYDIDVDATTVALTYNLAAGATDPTRVLAAGSYERYYVDFDFDGTLQLGSAAARTSQASVPNVAVVGDNTLMIEFGPGMQIGAGVDAIIDLDVEAAGSLVHGRVWQDLNNNGNKSNSEPWLNGWTLDLTDVSGAVVNSTYSRNIDFNNDGLIDPATEMGVYVFEGVQNGTYTVEQVLKDGWTAKTIVNQASVELYNLDQSLNLRPAQNDFLNWGGLNERWMLGSAGWYFITPDGNFYQWDFSPSTALTGSLVASLDPAVYNNPSQLHTAAQPVNNVVNVQTPMSVTTLNFGNYLPPTSFFVSTDEATNQLTLDWAASGGDASTYDVWITDLANARPVDVTYGIVGTTYQTAQIQDRPYRVWMRTQYSPGVYSPWTFEDTELFSDAVNPRISGLDAGIDYTPTLTWDTVAGATSYDLRVLRNGVEIYRAESLPTESHRIAQRLALGSYTVELRASFAAGNTTNWSDGETLTISGQPIVTMVNNVATWTPVNAATHYEIWVDRVDDNNQQITRQVVYAADLVTTNFPLAGLSRGRYSVWVRAIRSEAGDSYPSYWSPRVTHIVVSAESEQSGDEDVQLVRWDVEVEEEVAVAAVAEYVELDEASDNTAGEQATASDESTTESAEQTDLMQLMQSIAENGIPVTA